MKSKIFDEYVKVAKENGLIADEDIVKKAYSLADARVGSDSEEKIRMMYGLKPNGAEDDTHIVDKAHPESAVVAPAYDAMNAIVENVKERQNMMAYIAQKMPNGQLSHRRYVHYDQEKYEGSYDMYRDAAEDLKGTLIRVGFTMDNNKEEKLMKLADNCAERINKVAMPWLLPIIGAAGLLLSYVGIVNNNPVSEGVLNDVDDSITELSEAMKSTPPVIANEMSSLVSVLTSFREIAGRYYNLPPIKLDVNNPDIKDLLNVRTNSDDMGKMRIAREYQAAVGQLSNYLPQVINRIRAFADQEQNLPDWLAPLAQAARYIIPNDIEDAYKKLEALARALRDEQNRLSSSVVHGQKQGEQLAVNFQTMMHQEGIPSFNESATPKKSPAKHPAKSPAKHPAKQELPSEQSLESVLRGLM